MGMVVLVISNISGNISRIGSISSTAMALAVILV